MKYEMAAVQSCCPVCSAKEGYRLYAVNSDRAAQNFVLQQVEPRRYAKVKAAIERLWSGQNCRLVQCRGCDFIYADPYVAGDLDFYTHAYQRERYPADKWEYRRTVQALHTLQEKRFFESPVLLEIGAGNGQFLAMVTPAITTEKNIVCTEYSEYGKAIIEKKGIRCLQKNIIHLCPEELARTFDIICLFQVLEHMDGIHELFRLFSKITSKKAKIFIAVPGDRRMRFNELNGSLLDIPPNHIGRWNIKAFNIIAQKHGWMIEHHEIEPDSARAKIKQYVKYRYMREMQRAGSLANRVERLPASTLKTLLRMALGCGYTMLRLPALLVLLSRSDLGNSQWVQLTKERRIDSSGFSTPI